MGELTFSPAEQTYLSQQLNQVARTFALLPPFLDASLGAVMSAAYLICRVVDSIEDCQQPFDWKQRRFAEIQQLLHEPDRHVEVLQAWSTMEWRGLNPAETALMTRPVGEMLWQIFTRIPHKYRAIIQRWAVEMAHGMENTLNPAAAPYVVREGELTILNDLEDYNAYCYYVAGTVGYLQTELLQAFYNFSDEISETLRRTSLAFGLGLQKTNIIKDFLDDLNRGMVYLPYSWLTEVQKRPLAVAGATPSWIRHVLTDVRTVLDEAVEYITALPYRVSGVRQATLMCLLPAYQTVLLAAGRSKQLFTPAHHIKISRQVLATCFEDARRFAEDNQQLSHYRTGVNEQIEQLLSRL